MENGDFSSPEELQISFLSEFENLSNESGGSEIIWPSNDQLNLLQELATVDSCESSCPLGLTLQKTPSLVDLVEKTLEKGKEDHAITVEKGKEDHAITTDEEDHPIANDIELRNKSSQSKKKDSNIEKLKASNFPAKLLRIGRWQRVSTYEGDLTAKIYYAKRKIVWEILQRPLKSKIEMLWSDIIGIRATHEQGILEIELERPPSFFLESEPQPRKHTLWKQSLDFTGGEASTWRRHCIQFAPGILDKHYQMLLRCDKRLFTLSHQDLSSSNKPPTFVQSYALRCFDSNFNVYGHVPQRILPRVQYSHQTYPTSVTTTPLPPNSTPVWPIPTSTLTNYHILTQDQAVLGQGGNFPIARNVQVANAPHTNSVTQFSHLGFTHASATGTGNPNTPQVIYDVANDLFGDSRVVHYDQVSLPANAVNVNPNTRATYNDVEDFMSNEFYQQPMNSMPQYSNENVVMQPQVNNTFYPSMLGGSTTGNFSTWSSSMSTKKSS